MNLLRHQSTLEIRPGDSFRYAREILKPYGELDRILAWCKTEQDRIDSRMAMAID